MDLTDDGKCLKLAEQSRDENLHIPEGMIEHIITKMPFPSLFKTKLLSKVWNDKLLLSSDGARSSRTHFQKELTMMSTNWTTYCPVFFDKRGIRGFHRPSSEWKSLFSFSYLPILDWPCIHFLSSAGSLICLAPNNYRETMFVTNVFTQTWKPLLVPSVFKFLRHRRDHVKLLPVDSYTFKLLVLFTFEDRNLSTVINNSGRNKRKFSTAIYDSGSNKWEVYTPLVLPVLFAHEQVFPDSVYLGGKLYCMIGDSIGNPQGLWIHHLDTDFAWEPIIRDGLVSQVKQVAAYGGVLLCGQKIMIVLWWNKGGKKGHDEIESICPESSYFPLRYKIKLYELDLDLLRLVKVCVRLPGLLGLCLCQSKPFGYKGCKTSKCTERERVRKENIRCASDIDFIYFSHCDVPGKAILTYNVQNRNWGSLPGVCSSGCSMDHKSTSMSGSSFVPGLNPFAIV